MKRGIAIFTLILFCLALIALLFLAFTGGKKEYMLALLFCVMILPSLFYVYQWITRLIKKDQILEINCLRVQSHCIIQFKCKKGEQVWFKQLSVQTGEMKVRGRLQTIWQNLRTLQFVFREEPMRDIPSSILMDVFLCIFCPAECLTPM